MSNFNSAIPLDVLPPFMKDVEIIGSAADEALKFHAANVNTLHAAQKIDCEISAKSTPNIVTTKAVKQAYQNSNFNEIKRLEKLAQKDLKTLYDNISQYQEKAWVRTKCKVHGEIKEVYMSWSNNAVMWVMEKDMNELAKGDDTKYIADVEIGTYSKSTSIMGIHSYNLTLTSVLVESVICFIIAKALSGIVAQGLAFVVGNLAILVAQAAAQLGFTSFSCTIAVSALSTVATCLVFVVVFIGLTYLWDWLNRKYTIRLQIFNWDKDNDWSVAGDYTDNAIIAGEEKSKSLNEIVIKKLGNADLPEFITPIEVLDSICHYAVIVWENDSTFMQGCAMTLKIKKGSSNEGFMWGFDCPRFRDNKQAGKDGLMSPKDYYNRITWNKNPLKFSITSTSAKLPVSFALDALHGASDNLYNINININYKQ